MINLWMPRQTVPYPGTKLRVNGPLFMMKQLCFMALFGSWPRVHLKPEEEVRFGFDFLFQFNLYELRPGREVSSGKESCRKEIPGT